MSNEKALFDEDFEDVFSDDPLADLVIALMPHHDTYRPMSSAICHQTARLSTANRPESAGIG